MDYTNSLSSLDSKNSCWPFCFQISVFILYTVRHVPWLPIITVLAPSIFSKSVIFVFLHKQKIPQKLDYPCYVGPSIGEDLPEEGQKENQNRPQSEDVGCWKTGECRYRNEHVPHTDKHPPQSRRMKHRHTVRAGQYLYNSFKQLSKPQAYAFEVARLSCNPQ